MKTTTEQLLQEAADALAPYMRFVPPTRIPNHAAQVYEKITAHLSHPKPEASPEPSSGAVEVSQDTGNALSIAIDALFDIAISHDLSRAMCSVYAQSALVSVEALIGSAAIQALKAENVKPTCTACNTVREHGKPGLYHTGGEGCRLVTEFKGNKS